MGGRIRIGTAGWVVPRFIADQFPAQGSTLGRYGAVFEAAEINSSFHRPHRRETYDRWATAVPAGFRFAAKLPRSITHELRLVAAQNLLQTFLSQVEGLGEALGPLLVQLPPSLAFAEGAATDFFEDFRRRFDGHIVCEPRHPTWFEPRCDALLARLGVAIAAADPPRGRSRMIPAGWPGLAYFRLHGSPRTYWSSYTPADLAALATRLTTQKAAQIWCVFDNTASGAAAANALELRALLERHTAEEFGSRPDRKGRLPVLRGNVP